MIMQSWASLPNRSTAVLVRLSRSRWVLQHLPLVLGAAAPQALLLLLQRAEHHFFCSSAPSATSRWICQQPREGSAPALTSPPRFVKSSPASASVSRIDHSLAGPRIVFAMAHQHHALAPSFVPRFVPQLKQLVSLSPFMKLPRPRCTSATASAAAAASGIHGEHHSTAPAAQGNARAHNLWGPRASMARPWCASLAILVPVFTLEGSRPI